MSDSQLSVPSSELPTLPPETNLDEYATREVLYILEKESHPDSPSLLVPAYIIVGLMVFSVGLFTLSVIRLLRAMELSRHTDITLFGIWGVVCLSIPILFLLSGLKSNSQTDRLKSIIDILQKAQEKQSKNAD
jgi:hypothetical protein